MATIERSGMPDISVLSPEALAKQHAGDKARQVIEDDYNQFEKVTNWRVAAFKRNDAPVQKLSPSEQSIADNSVQHVRDLLKASSGPQPNDVEMLEGKDPVGQAQLDLSHDLSCLSHSELQKILPSINASLESSGLRLAEVPENKEVFIGERISNGDWVPSRFGTSLVGCKLN